MIDISYRESFRRVISSEEFIFTSRTTRAVVLMLGFLLLVTTFVGVVSSQQPGDQSERTLEILDSEIVGGDGDDVIEPGETLRVEVKTTLPRARHQLVESDGYFDNWNFADDDVIKEVPGPGGSENPTTMTLQVSYAELDQKREKILDATLGSDNFRIRVTIPQGELGEIRAGAVSNDITQYELGDGEPRVDIPTESPDDSEESTTNQGPDYERPVIMRNATIVGGDTDYTIEPGETLRVNIETTAAAPHALKEVDGLPENSLTSDDDTITKTPAPRTSQIPARMTLEVTYAELHEKRDAIIDPIPLVGSDDFRIRVVVPAGDLGLLHNAASTGEVTQFELGTGEPEADQSGSETESEESDSDTIRNLNQPPEAALSSPTEVTAGQEFTLDASASSDPDDDDHTYVWTVTSTPEDANPDQIEDQIIENNPGHWNDPRVSLSLDTPGEYEFEVEVKDSYQGDRDTTTIVVDESDSESATPPTDDSDPDSITQPPDESDSGSTTPPSDESDSESGDSTGSPDSITFVGCQRVQVNGEYGEAEVEVRLYDGSGIQTETVHYDNLQGETTLSPGNDNGRIPTGANGYAIQSAQLYEDEDRLGDEGYYRNPDVEQCNNEIRPERPSIEFDSAEAVGDGRIEVTFSTSHSNNRDLTLNTEVTAGNTDDRYPDGEVKPGSDTITVVWTPQSGSETLELTTDLERYGYEDQIVVETPPASEFLQDDSGTTTGGSTETNDLGYTLQRETVCRSNTEDEDDLEECSSDLVIEDDEKLTSVVEFSNNNAPIRVIWTTYDAEGRDITDSYKQDIDRNADGVSTATFTTDFNILFDDQYGEWRIDIKIINRETGETEELTQSFRLVRSR